MSYGNPNEWDDVHRERVPRGNGVNVHLKSGVVVFVQENHREVQSAWTDARRPRSREAGRVITFQGKAGKRVTLAPEDIDRIEEL